MDKKNSILEKLEKNAVKTNDDQQLALTSDDDLINDAEDDFDYARTHIKGLIDTSDDAIQMMHNLAADAEHPRAFEVLGNLIKQNAEMNNQLMDLSSTRKKLRQDTSDISHGSTTNNSIFVGTTAELQKFLTNYNSDNEDLETLDID